jgi:hypothetical protein
MEMVYPTLEEAMADFGAFPSICIGEVEQNQHDEGSAIAETSIIDDGVTTNDFETQYPSLADAMSDFGDFPTQVSSL